MVITEQELRASFVAEGISIREWALARGYSVSTVYAVVRGEVRCTRGVSHKIAVELGLKAAPKRTRLSLATDKAA